MLATDKSLSSSEKLTELLSSLSGEAYLCIVTAFATGALSCARTKPSSSLVEIIAAGGACAFISACIVWLTE